MIRKFLKELETINIQKIFLSGNKCMIYFQFLKIYQNQILTFFLLHSELAVYYTGTYLPNYSQLVYKSLSGGRKRKQIVIISCGGECGVVCTFSNVMALGRHPVVSVVISQAVSCMCLATKWDVSIREARVTNPRILSTHLSDGQEIPNKMAS